MSLLPNRLNHFLDRHAVDYQQIHHKRDYTAQTAAQDTRTPGHFFIKPVILKVGDGFAMAIVPADRQVDLARIAEWLDADEVRLASEQETFNLFPDCEVGAEPPFGNLYGVPMYLDPDLTQSCFVTFNGGTHETAVRMAWADYRRLVQPAVVDIVMLK